MIVVSDTSPIRGLLSIGKSYLLRELFEKVTIPFAVRNELFCIKAAEIDVESFLDESWVIINEIGNKTPINELRKHLDPGESEVIVLAQEIDAAFILMDEHKGRKIAKTLGMDVIGLVGILILAKEKHLLNKVKPHLDELREDYGFWINEAFYTKILKSINEL